MTILDKIIQVVILTFVLSAIGVVAISFLDQRPSMMRLLMCLWALASLAAAMIWPHEEAEQGKRGRK